MGFGMAVRVLGPVAHEHEGEILDYPPGVGVRGKPEGPLPPPPPSTTAGAAVHGGRSSFGAAGGA